MKKLLSTSYLLLAVLAAPVSSKEANVLHPDFPVVAGNYQMTKEWSIVLPDKFNRRIEEGSLVLWRPGFTMWVTVWGNDRNESAVQRLSRIKNDISKEAFDLEESKPEKIRRFSYRLKESSNDKRLPAFYCFAVGETGHVQMAIYFDKESDLKIAKKIFQSLNEKTAP
jgi:hypothetical protein